MHVSFHICGETTNISQLQLAEVCISFAWPGESLRSFAAPTSNPPAILEAHAEHRRGLHIYTTRRKHPTFGAGVCLFACDVFLFLA